MRAVFSSSGCAPTWSTVATVPKLLSSWRMAAGEVGTVSLARAFESAVTPKPTANQTINPGRKLERRLKILLFNGERDGILCVFPGDLDQPAARGIFLHCDRQLIDIVSA